MVARKGSESMAKRILSVLAHPHEDSLCAALHDVYVGAAKAAGAEVRTLDLKSLDFDLSFGGYRHGRELEPALQGAQEDILWAEHLVFVYPVWWGAMPALLKGFIDRTFLPGFAFRYREDSPMPARLLDGRSARVVITMDAPVWYYRIANRGAAETVMKKCVLQFSGVKSVAVTRFGAVRESTEARRAIWLDQMRRLGSSLS